MKKITFIASVLCFLLFFGSVHSQTTVQTAKSLKSSLKVVKPAKGIKGDLPVGLKPVSIISNHDAVLDDPVLFTTRYDLQTNSSTQNRIYYYPDGSVSAVGMMSHNDAFSDRGTGYNRNTGGGWEIPPATRIESSKAGWPSYAPLGANGEIFTTHHNTAGLFVCSRPERGTGNWTETILVGPAGAEDISWPRIVTNGPDNMYVHIICLTYQVYQGLDLAFLYYRSLDGGQTWDIQHEIIDGMTSAEYLGFSADNYNWAQPKGDTLAFVFGDSWNDQCVMKSYDNGESWEKIKIWSCPWNLWNGGDTTGTFYGPDGASAIALDKDGNAHVTFGLMRANGDENGAHYWLPWTDGLVYWNESMPELPESMDPELLRESGNLIGEVVDTMAWYALDTELPYYFVSMTSQPAICVDDDNFVFVVWSGVTSNFDPDNFILRHLYARGSDDGGTTWGDVTDLNADFLYTWSECVYPSMSWTTDDYLYIEFQRDEYGGVYLNGSQGAQGQAAVSDNELMFLKPLKWDILWPIGIEDKPNSSALILQNFPNPVQDFTTIRIQTQEPGNLSLKITNAIGQQVFQSNKGYRVAGTHEFTIDASDFAKGIYFYSVTVNQSTVTRKMIVD